MSKRPRRRGNRTGRVRQLPSGRWQAHFTGPDGVTRPAPQTFDTKLDADAWCKRQARDVELGRWEPPDSDNSRPLPAPTLDTYAATWIAARRLAQATREKYENTLNLHVLGDLGGHRIDEITVDDVRAWYASCAPGHPSARAHAYGLLASLMSSAVDDELLDRSPCRVRGGGVAVAQREIDILDQAELVALYEAMPQELRLTVVLGCWCSLRLGEVLALQRRDIDLTAGSVTVNRTAIRVAGGTRYGAGKSAAARRTVTVPPHVLPLLAAHLDEHTGPGATALLFPSPKTPGKPLPNSTFYPRFHAARAEVGRPELHFHDLRHTGATWSAQVGATVAELMERLGHTTPQMAMRYQHAAAQRQALIADRLSTLADVVPIRSHVEVVQPA